MACGLIDMSEQWMIFRGVYISNLYIKNNLPTSQDILSNIVLDEPTWAYKTPKLSPGIPKNMYRLITEEEGWIKNEL